MTNAKLRPTQGVQIDLSKKYMWDPSVAQEYVDLCQKIATDFEISLEEAQAYADAAIENGKKTENDRIAVEQYRNEVENISIEVEENRVLTQTAATSASDDADIASASRVAALASQGACASYDQSARESAQSALNYSTTAEIKAMESEDAALRAEQAATEAGNITVFSINEASKDASGSPDFMSVVGEQITFNGAVKYTQANGESKEYASVSPIALEKTGFTPWVQPVLTSNSSNLSMVVSNTNSADANNCFKMFDGNDSTYFLAGDEILDNEARWVRNTIKFDTIKRVESVFARGDLILNVAAGLGGIRVVNADGSVIKEMAFTQQVGQGTLVLDEVLETTELFVELFVSGSLSLFPTRIVSMNIMAETEKYKDGYVVLNNGVASVVPALEVQQSEPLGGVWEQPVLTSDTSYGVVTSSSNSDVNTNWKCFNGVVGTDNNEWSASGTTGWLSWNIGEEITIESLSFYNIISSTSSSHTKEFQIFTDATKTIALTPVLTAPNTNSGLVEYSLPEPVKTSSIYIECISSYGSYCGCQQLNIKAREFTTNQTVWFNPYNNQAKQFNGTDWVDYNGVPVGKIYNEQAINFYHNTYGNLLPELFISGTGEQLVDSYVNGSSFYDIYAKNVNGEVKYWCEQGGVYEDSTTSIKQGLITLFIPYNSSGYNVSYVANTGSNSGNWATGALSVMFAKAETSFTVQHQGGRFIEWATQGYCNKPEEIL